MKISASPTLNILGAAALSYALYLPIALWLQHSYVPRSHPSPPPRLAAKAWPLATIYPYGHGGKFHAHLDVFGPLEEDNEAEQHSPVVPRTASRSDRPIAWLRILLAKAAAVTPT